MIKRIDIQNFGQFKDYNWSLMIGHKLDFSKLNIIYGRNYSGKTTLSRIFRCIEKGEMHKNYCNGSFTLIMDDGTKITQHDIASFKMKFRVYNSDFVSENLSWLHNSDGTIEPFTILGEVNVEIQKSIQEIERKLGTLEDNTGLVYKYETLNAQKLTKESNFNTIKNALDGKLKAKALDIKKNTALFDKPVYTITHLKADIEVVSDKSIMTADALDACKKLVKEEPKVDIPLLKVSKPHFHSYYDRVKDLVERPIKPSVPIADLINNALLQQWVYAGIDHHKNIRTTCGFCGGELPPDLWKKLDAHFVEESAILRNDINSELTVLQNAGKAIKQYLLLKPESFYTDIKDKYNQLKAQWDSEIITYVNNCDLLILALTAREKDIFSSLQLQQIEDNSDSLYNILLQINECIKEHNAKTKKLSSEQASTRDKMRKSDIATFLKTIEYHKECKAQDQLAEQIVKEQQNLDKLKVEIDGLIEERRVLLAKTKNETKGAELVNEYLSHFFGHQELKLVAESADTGMRFIINRDNGRALNLSEGEASLISFCYFMARLKDELKHDGPELYIYIDDPISSLDSNHTFFVFSLIESIIAKHQNYNQLFISTHSLDFLKYIKQLTKPIEGTSFYLMQKKAKNHTALIKAPDYLKKYVTEFNYLFSEIYACAIENEQSFLDHHFYSFGNNMRKFLESYLYFKYPCADMNLGARINMFFEPDVISINLINRLVQEYSHLNEQFDRGTIPIDVEEMRKVAIIVLNKIKEKDPDQYIQLCQSVKVKSDHVFSIGENTDFSIMAN
jgi:wobble nucleotide-excising tRNase